MTEAELQELLRRHPRFWHMAEVGRWPDGHYHGESFMTSDGVDTTKKYKIAVDIEIDGRLQTLPMTDGRGSVTVPPGAHVAVDPQNKALRQLDFVDDYQAWREAERQKRAAARLAS